MLAGFAAALLGLSTADSTPRPISELVHSRWTAKDGAPIEPRALAQTTDGYLWVGHKTGLVRFDGVRFVPFVPQRGDTIPTVGVRRLLGAHDGSLWIVWRNGGVSRLRNGRVTTYGERDGLSSAFVVTESGDGTLVAGTATGLALFDNGKWKDVSRDWQYPGTESKATWFDREGTLWAETQDRVVYRPPGSREFIDPGMPLLAGSRSNIADFAESKDGTIWMAELGRSAHTISRLGDRTPVTEVLVGSWTLVVDRKGSVWVGSAGDGIRRVIDPARVRGKKIAQFGTEAEHFTEKEGLLSNLVLAMMEDREGNIWVATLRGLERFREGAFTPIPDAGPVAPRVIYATRDTSVWVVTYNANGLTRLRPHDRSAVATEFVPLDLAQDPAGVTWTTQDSLILRLERDRFVPIRLARKEAHRIVDITVDSAGTLWAFDETLGLMRLSHDSLVRVAPLGDPGFPHGYVTSDRRGRIWVAQQHRVAVYDHGRLTVYTSAKHEVPWNVSSVFEDRTGNIWVAGDGGLSKLGGGRFRALSQEQNFAGEPIYGGVEDVTGAFWILTRNGVHRLARGELDRAFADTSYVIRERTFTGLDGLPGMIASGFYGPLITESVDGMIWVATDSGVAKLNPRNVPSADAPPVLIEAVRVNGRELLPSDTISIPPGGRDLEIDYTSTHLATPEQVEFRYRLEGKDTEWRNVGTRRRAYYSGLGPGTYRFRVNASSGEGAWNASGALWTFRVLPSWYQTLWFRVTLGLLIAGLGAMVAALVQRRRHLRVQKALSAQYEATLAERARIAQDLHDTLLQGFAGVTLQLKAAELALPDEPDVAVETIMRVHQLARTSLREARERVWDMRETDLGTEDLPAALEAVARERAAGSAIEICVSTTGERRRLTKSVEDAAFRIGREAVVNAVRHAEPRRIEIQVDFRTASLRLEVRDDGRGFTPQDAEEARRNGHFGLTGARERAGRMGGRCDLLARHGGGTIVALELPLADLASR